MRERNVEQVENRMGSEGLTDLNKVQFMMLAVGALFCFDSVTCFKTADDDTGAGEKRCLRTV
jgi:hypothetical protein